jgi:hypothetical protein
MRGLHLSHRGKARAVLTSERKIMGRSRLIALVVWLFWGPVAFGVVYLIANLFFSGMEQTRNMGLWFERNFLMSNPVLWFYLFIEIIGIAIIMFNANANAMNKKLAGGAIAMLIVSLIGSGSIWIKGMWDIDKDFARYYNRATTFVIPNPDQPPAAVGKLMEGARRQNGSDCEYVGNHDVPSCIQSGTLPEAGWETRSASLTGAMYYIARTTGTDQRIKLLESSLTYLYGNDPESGQWSGILDGSGKEKAMHGVAMWGGDEKVEVCTFKPGYSVGRALGGERGNNLQHLLADQFPRLQFSNNDIWGYCDGDKPVIVFPVVEQAQFKQRSIVRPAGVLVMRGTAEDRPHFQHHKQIKAGELPGPVYPLAMVEQQRDSTQWAAGRKNQGRNSFGFEPTDSEPQVGNASEYLLRSQVDGRLYWVSPLTPRNSTSQLFVTYAVTPADEVSAGKLNRFSVYVLGEGDPRIVNVDDLEARTLDYLSRHAPAFRPNGGTIVEFTPTTGDVFRAFGEIKGRVVYRLEISASNRVAPQLVQLTDDTPDAPVSGVLDTSSSCGKPLVELTPTELTGCIRSLAVELDRRQTQPAG